MERLPFADHESAAPNNGLQRKDALTVGLPTLTVCDIPGKGRGVIANQAIEAGTLLERCPVLVIPSGERRLTDQTVVFTYVYMWEHGTREQDLYRHQGRAAIALGLSSLLNHSYSPNARFVRHIDKLELELRAGRAICCGEEVTIDYDMALWFNCA
jgi:SET domain-containing protein